MTGLYDRDISASLKSIAESMKTLAAHFSQVGDAATFAGKAAQGLSDQVHFISEDGE
jgi:hypothetical protein